PNIWAAADYVRRWPQAYLQFRRLMDSFHPMIDRNVPESEYNIRLGSNSHSDEPMFGAMYASYFDPLGTAEAMVHEMAHNKLRGLGVYVEWAQRIITNPPDELFESPIRKDVLRPMTAVLHAQYSFIHVTQLDLKMIAAETDETMIPKMLFLLAANVPRMEEGFDEMRRNAKLDATGELFMDAFNRWSDKVIEEGNRLLEKHGVAKHATMRVTAND
ncbi:MAG: HEXXH motif domain-containing protein, partial [Armatimonadetes bacterium]|nr:HEXXH motif domain-containing protein [Armatimonadota bacterium]